MVALLSPLELVPSAIFDAFAVSFKQKGNMACQKSHQYSCHVQIFNMLMNVLRKINVVKPLLFQETIEKMKTIDKMFCWSGCRVLGGYLLLLVPLNHIQIYSCVWTVCFLQPSQCQGHSFTPTNPVCTPCSPAMEREGSQSRSSADFFDSTRIGSVSICVTRMASSRLLMEEEQTSGGDL